jgi:COP9 signalosome complex subunit 6
VIINISDHSTRFQCLNGGKMKRVLGVLLGKLDGRSVEVCNSFEISYKEVDGKIKYDKDYFEVKQEQYKKVFPSLDPVGWYSNAIQSVRDGEVLPGDIDVHGEIAAIIENPLYLLLDTTDGAGVRDLPVQILESEVLSCHFVFCSSSVKHGASEAMAGEHGAREGMASLDGASQAMPSLEPFFSRSVLPPPCIFHHFAPVR